MDGNWRGHGWCFLTPFIFFEFLLLVYFGFQEKFESCRKKSRKCQVNKYVYSKRKRVDQVYYDAPESMIFYIQEEENTKVVRHLAVTCSVSRQTQKKKNLSWRARGAHGSDQPGPLTLDWAWALSFCSKAEPRCLGPFNIWDLD